MTTLYLVLFSLVIIFILLQNVYLHSVNKRLKKTLSEALESSKVILEAYKKYKKLSEDQHENIQSFNDIIHKQNRLLDTNYNKNNKVLISFDLDEILSKISKNGIKSISTAELNFLKNCRNDLS